MTVEARPADARALGGGLAGRLRGPRFQHVLFGVVLRGSLSGVRGTATGELSLEAYAAVLTSPQLAAAVSATLVFAVCSSCLGIAIGGVLAWLVERTDAPCKQLLYASTFVSFAVPGIIRVIGWVFLLGPRSGYLNEAARAVFGPGVGFDVFSMA